VQPSCALFTYGASPLLDHERSNQNCDNIKK
jgi:hypothetical protein